MVQIGRSTITPGQLYRREGLSENADRHSPRTTRRKQLAEAGSAPSPLDFLPQTIKFWSRNLKRKLAIAKS